MVTFRRRRSSNTWHWCRNCSNWPTSNYDSSLSKPPGGAPCNECQRKQRKGICMTWPVQAKRDSN